MIPFCKFHGFGNDYIVIEKTAVPDDTDLSALAKAICHRHTGAGADGIAVVSTGSGSDRTLQTRGTSGADFFCEIVNPDGSVAGFSGNGTRCAVSYIYYKDLWAEPHLRLETRSGVKNYQLIKTESPGHYWFEAEIGTPKFASGEVPISTPEPMDSVIDFTVETDGWAFLVSCVNVGNPVACLFVERFPEDWRDVGKALETHRLFPDRANIVFVRVIDKANIELRIWERGVGETSSSGTCVSGAAALSAFTGRTDRKVSVRTEGGTTEFLWRDDGEIVITGRADLAYIGEFPMQKPAR